MPSPITVYPSTLSLSPPPQPKHILLSKGTYLLIYMLQSGLSLLLECKCQERKDSCSSSVLQFSTSACPMDQYWDPLSLPTLFYPLDINIICVDAVRASYVDISLEYQIYISNCLLGTWIFTRYLKFNMYSSLSHLSLKSLI